VLSQWQQVAREQKRRCYELTEKGRQILPEELAELSKFCSAADKVMGS
jgi:predicted transcriptional regulator